jgi:uncharacterized protein (DUF1810 family)
MLEKFLNAQESTYQKAYAELERGKKRSHWMWYIFPQIVGLGWSENSTYYSLSGLKEAELYLRHPVLGSRLVSITDILIKLPTRNAFEIFGSPDDMKLQSCMTLFSLVPGSDPVFGLVLEKFFKGDKDHNTLNILKQDMAG